MLMLLEQTVIFILKIDQNKHPAIVIWDNFDMLQTILLVNNMSVLFQRMAMLTYALNILGWVS